MTEVRDIKIKRLRMRSMRRGIKEMDLILSDFAARSLDTMTDDALVHYDRMLSENDIDLFSWINGQHPAPEEYLDLITAISAGADGLTRPA